MFDFDKYLTTDENIINDILKRDEIYDKIWLDLEHPTKDQVKFGAKSNMDYYNIPNHGLVFTENLNKNNKEFRVIHLALYKKGSGRKVLSEFFKYLKEKGVHSAMSYVPESREDVRNVAKDCGCQEKILDNNFVLLTRRLAV